MATDIRNSPLTVDESKVVPTVDRIIASDRPDVPLLMICTDMGEDIDDALALAMTHRLCDLGEANIVAIANSFSTVAGCAAISAINVFYARPDIPIGLGGIVAGTDTFRTVLSGFPNRVEAVAPPTAVSVFRRALAASPDASVTWVVEGPLTVLKDVWASAADDISSLSGPVLMAKKLKELIVCGGIFPDGGSEYNFAVEPVGTQVINSMSGFPITFSGYSVGLTALTSTTQEAWSPVSAACAAYVAYGGAVPRPSWGQAALLYAIRGEAAGFSLSSPGTCAVNSLGNNTWTASASGHHRYLIQTASDASLQSTINGLQNARPRPNEVCGRFDPNGITIHAPISLAPCNSAPSLGFWRRDLNGGYAGYGSIAADGDGITRAKIGGGTVIGSHRRAYPVLVGGTVTVADTAISTNSEITVGVKTPGGTTGALRVVSKTAGVGYTITSSSGTDTSTLAVTIVEP